MSTIRLKELLGRVVVGSTLSLQEREELLTFLLNFAANETLINCIAFTSNGIGVPVQLYNDVCLILKDGKYYNETSGRFYNKNKIAAIKLIRERLGCGLKEAKDISEDKHFPDYGQYVGIC